MSIEGEVFHLFICLDANKFEWLSFFSLIKAIYQRVSAKPLPNDTSSLVSPTLTSKSLRLTVLTMFLESINQNYGQKQLGSMLTLNGGQG